MATMEEFENKDSFLAKWASGELSEAEKAAFRKSKDYVFYKAILEGTDGLDVPKYNKDNLFEKIKKEKNKGAKVIKLPAKWMYAVAASVALFLGYVWFSDKTITHITGFGEQITLQLPDGSEIILNSGSELSYKKENWEDGLRTTHLTGEAFFKVEKGSDFIVETDNGNVTVLGTQFTVNTYGGFFHVACFEGKVAVAANEIESTLTQGEAMRLYNGKVEEFNFKSPTPKWNQGESNFENTPLYQVIYALERQYGVSIHADNIDAEQLFTGSFTHTNLDIALRSVFESMQIKFTFSNKNTIVLG